MSAYTEDSQFEELLEEALAPETPTTGGTAPATNQVDTAPAVPAAKQAHIEPGISVALDIQITTTRSDWQREFRQASSSQRAIMLSQIMDAFNDGVEGIFISFSEPVVK